jgi:hypothetical protein
MGGSRDKDSAAHVSHMAVRIAQLPRGSVVFDVVCNRSLVYFRKFSIQFLYCRFRSDPRSSVVLSNPFPPPLSPVRV